MLEESDLLIVRQPFGLHGSIRKENDDARTNDDGDEAEGKEHGSPSSKLGIRAHVLEAKRYNTANDLAEAETKVPEREARSRLRLGIPLTADEHQ